MEQSSIAPQQGRGTSAHLRGAWASRQRRARRVSSKYTWHTNVYGN